MSELPKPVAPPVGASPIGAQLETQQSALPDAGSRPIFDWPAYLDQFSHYLLHPQQTAVDQTGPLAALVSQPGFAVYRNTFLKACVDALEGNYPCVARLVGADWFRAAAARYALASPPVEPMLSRYGAGFAEFLDHFEPARELPYLPDVARLDRAWTESHLAMDAAALTLQDLAAMAPERFTGLTLIPHPAARWLWFDDSPIYSIWQANREESEINHTPAWHGEGALLTRPEDDVVWRSVSRPACRLLDACAAGLPLEDAANTALTDLAEELRAPALSPLLGELISAGAFLAVDAR